jgi:hypothetical protein
MRLESLPAGLRFAKRLTLAIWRSNSGGHASGGFNRHLTFQTSE